MEEALVEADPVAPRPPFVPIVLLTNTGVSYFSNENPYYAAVVDACWNYDIYFKL
mgnify:FL=1